MRTLPIICALVVFSLAVAATASPISAVGKAVGVGLPGSYDVGGLNLIWEPIPPPPPPPPEEPQEDWDVQPRT